MSSFAVYLAINGAVGCMDTSSHLKEKYDTKGYRYVSCQCPCAHITAHRGQCMQCKHFRVPKELETVTINKQKAIAPSHAQLLKKPLFALQEMVNRYRTSK